MNDCLKHELSVHLSDCNFVVQRLLWGLGILTSQLRCYVHSIVCHTCVGLRFDMPLIKRILIDLIDCSTCIGPLTRPWPNSSRSASLTGQMEYVNHTVNDVNVWKKVASNSFSSSQLFDRFTLARKPQHLLYDDVVPPVWRSVGRIGRHEVGGEECKSKE